MSEPQPPAKKITRSRTGCWTCRERRKKCDEKRPSCTPCIRKSLKCSGYGPRLKWGNGVASRGYLTGSTIPVQPKDGSKRGKKPSISQTRSDEDNSNPSHPSISPGLESSSTATSQTLNFATPPSQNEFSSPDGVSQRAVPLVFQGASPSITAIPLSPFDERLFQEC